MALRALILFVAVWCAFAGQQNLHSNLRIPDVSNGEIPTVGEEVGKQAGVDVPNPHAYTGALVGGGAAGVFVTIAIFCVATYMCYNGTTISRTRKKGNLIVACFRSCAACAALRSFAA